MRCLGPTATASPICEGSAHAEGVGISAKTKASKSPARSAAALAPAETLAEPGIAHARQLAADTRGRRRAEIASSCAERATVDVEISATGFSCSDGKLPCDSIRHMLATSD
ncbi:hypothetical protein PHYPSEUDO_014981 [Phytophthora pseudosyringae]|uniref:Uncharacterized protein n=1 Tax=Phytophthora pseudosyringae TaxID=221518 RepID=A0A8T1WKV0_9STRA|nr:hypothetical protein PHYPSEUDO_014981 [Phytophthora pseudosyringae]